MLISGDGQIVLTVSGNICAHNYTLTVFEIRKELCSGHIFISNYMFLVCNLLKHINRSDGYVCRNVLKLISPSCLPFTNVALNLGKIGGGLICRPALTLFGPSFAVNNLAVSINESDNIRIFPGFIKNNVLIVSGRDLFNLLRICIYPTYKVLALIGCKSGILYSMFISPKLARILLPSPSI